MPNSRKSYLNSNIFLALFWTPFMSAQLIASSLLVWEIGVQFNFGYNLGYKVLNINEHIQTYAPQNLHKEDFAFTSKNERFKLFHETLNAIENRGEGLDKIAYELPNRKLMSLYTPAEITHLKDVANLIHEFFITGLIAIFIWILGLVAIRRYKLIFPSALRISVGATLLSALICLSLFLLGPTKVFYWLHTKIFPENHQWYFYYQESLMATFMKAPDLFGFIGIELLAGILLLFTGFSFLAKRITRN